MLAGTDGKLLSEWMQYAEIEPFGEERSDLRNSVLITTIVNMFSGKGSKAKISDFMLKFEPPEQKKPIKDPESLLRKFFKK